MKTLTLEHDGSAFVVRGTNFAVGPAAVSEYDAVCEYLARRINDNATLQSHLGLLGVPSFRFALARHSKGTRAPKNGNA